MRAALAGGRAIDERWHLRKDGARFWGQGELMPLREPGGETIGFLKILRDRTDAMRAQGETRRVRDELQVVTDALPVLISFIDRDHVYRGGSGNLHSGAEWNFCLTAARMAADQER
jgi:PAS domain-containing protein